MSSEKNAILEGQKALVEATMASVMDDGFCHFINGLSPREAQAFDTFLNANFAYKNAVCSLAMHLQLKKMEEDPEVYCDKNYRPNVKKRVLEAIKQIEGGKLFLAYLKDSYVENPVGSFLSKYAYRFFAKMVHEAHWKEIW